MTRVSVHKVKPAPSATGSAPSWFAATQRFGLIQRRSDGQSPSVTVPPIVHEVLRSPGQPLDAATRAYMEPRFGHDFSKVRVHADGKAAEAARAVDALAYTVGRDVVFGEGQYRPANREGRHLLAHELTHVVQQSAPSDSGALHLDNPNSAEEGMAQRASERILSGGSEQIVPMLDAPRLQRQVMAANQPAKRELNGCRILFVKGTTTFASPPQSDECLSLLATYLKPDPDYKAVPYKTTLLGFGSGEDGDKAGIKSMSTARAEAVKQWLMTSVSGISAEQIEVHGEGADFSFPQQGVVVVFVKQVAVALKAETPPKRDEPQKQDEPQKRKKDEPQKQKKDEPQKQKKDEPQKQKKDEPQKQKKDEPQKQKKDESQKQKKDERQKEDEPCNPMDIDVTFEWADAVATPNDQREMDAVILEVISKWKPCNTSVQVVINTPWKGNKFAPHPDWYWNSPTAVMTARATLIQDALRIAGIPPSAFLQPILKFEQPARPNSKIVNFGQPGIPWPYAQVILK
jgi:outer membrane protein OmpA-like peptidoglycan-associated protein